MQNDNTSGGTVILAFIVGALTGAGVALLFAPAAGEETREYLGQKAREGRARALDAVEQGRARALDAVEQGREAYQTQRDSLTSAVERGREAFQQARDKREQNA